MREIEVWVAYGDDHDYDCMSQWLIGVYETEEEAELAGKADRRKYSGPKSRHNVSIESTILRLKND